MCMCDGLYSINCVALNSKVLLSPLNYRTRSFNDIFTQVYLTIVDNKRQYIYSFDGQCANVR